MSWYSEEDEKLQNAIDSLKDDLYFILECVKNVLGQRRL